MNIGGIEVGSSELKMVVLEQLSDEKFKLLTTRSLKLGAGPRPEGFKELGDSLLTILDSQKLDLLYVNATVVPRPAKMGHMEAAELRGVVQAAASRHMEIIPISNATISQRFGQRKSAEYLKDDDFWEEHVSGEMLKGFRPAALIAIAGRALK